MGRSGRVSGSRSESMTYTETARDQNTARQKIEKEQRLKEAVVRKACRRWGRYTSLTADLHHCCCHAETGRSWQGVTTAAGPSEPHRAGTCDAPASHRAPRSEQLWPA